jgi:hypothetical protein
MIRVTLYNFYNYCAQLENKASTNNLFAGWKTDKFSLQSVINHWYRNRTLTPPGKMGVSAHQFNGS